MAFLSKKQKLLLSVFILAFSAAFFVLGLKWKRTFVRYPGRIPFVIDEQLYKTISHFINSFPSYGVLAITGPLQIGKSRLLEEFSSNLIQKNRFSIFIDLDAISSEQEAIGVFKMSFLHALSKLIDNETEYNSTYAVFDSFFNSVVDYPYRLASFIDILEPFFESMKPAVFINGFDQLFKVAPKLADSLLNKFNQRNVYESPIPILLEIRNSLLRFTFKNLIFVDLENLVNPSFKWTIKHRCFSRRELQYATDIFGGHGGTLERIFEDLKMDISIMRSVAEKKSIISRTISSVLFPEMNKVFSQICQRNSSFQFETVHSLSSVRRLFENGILHSYHNLAISFGNVFIKNLICSTLQLNITKSL